MAACAGRSAGSAIPPEARVPSPRPLASVYLLEASGGPPGDTTVTIEPGRARVVVLRHPAPDYAVFAEVAFDSGSFAAGSGEVRVTIRPRPGLYGIDLEASAPLREALVTFKYAVHFLAPAGARTDYGSDIGFERELFVGRLEGEQVTFLPSTHPATDNLAADLPGTGSYVVGAPTLQTSTAADLPRSESSSAGSRQSRR
ncbi:MAG TPA: hypothetical protein VFU00_11900 [Gemmatimonadales bacterium]|nr:hypothetical protein [Gemmatimonadales bacterium]